MIATIAPAAIGTPAEVADALALLFVLLDDGTRQVELVTWEKPVSLECWVLTLRLTLTAALLLVLSLDAFVDGGASVGAATVASSTTSLGAVSGTHGARMTILSPLAVIEVLAAWAV